MQKFGKKYKAYKAEIAKGEISEGFIRGFRKSLHANERRLRGYSTSITAPNITNEEVDLILSMIEEKKPRVSTVQGAKGLAWLLTYWKTPKGAERKNNPYNSEHIHVLENYSHFELVDFENVNSGHGLGLAFYVPVYRCIAKDGKYFDYYAVSWQSGGEGGPVIL